MAHRYSFSTIGRRASPLFSYTLPISTSTLRTVIPPQLVQSRHQTRSASSSVPGLTPPWQFQDMSQKERVAYERWGPSYLEKMTPEARAELEKYAAKRDRIAADYSARFGTDWYEIMQEATRIKDASEEQGRIRYLEETKLLPKSNRVARKEYKRKYNEELKESKAERMQEAMELVARRRKS